MSPFNKFGQNEQSVAMSKLRCIEYFRNTVDDYKCLLYGFSVILPITQLYYKKVDPSFNTRESHGWQCDAQI